MTLEPERKQQLDDQWLESLLHESYATGADAAADSARVNQALARLDELQQVTTASRTSPLRWQRWASIALVASALIAAGLFFTYLTPPSAAHAAVIRSLKTVPPIRLYRLSMVHQRPIWGTREVTGDLYLNDRDQFVVRHPGWGRLGDVWIGGDANSRWIVPRFGSAYTGRKDIVGGWLSKKDIPSPYLHVSTILERMSRVYDLEFVGHEPVAHADAPESVSQCQHVRGKRNNENSALPSTIELWADLETGIARRLELTWERPPAERGPVAWTIELMGTPELPQDWFELEGHITPGRTVVQIQTAAALDAAENDSD